MNNLPIKIELPEGFLQEEERSGFTITCDMKKVWAVEIDILFQIKAICDRHNIKWFVEGGTLLGAVRHKGFIPWDDDIDIDMLREDYENFIYYAKRELRSPYFLQTHETDSLSMYGHTKVRNSLTTSMQIFEYNNQLDFNQGIFVDIFPLDKVSDSFTEAKQYTDNVIRQFCLSRERLYNCCCYKCFPFRKNILLLLKRYITLSRDKINYRIKGRQYIEDPYSKFEEMCVRYKESNYHHRTVYALPFSMHRYWPDSLFDCNSVMMPFEWFEVPATRNYTTYLDITYGDWHKFVKGGSLHGDMIFDTQKPYNHYLKL